MSSKLTRREFLRLSGAALAAALLPTPLWSRQSTGPTRMGRAIHASTIYQSPASDADRLGTYNHQDVFAILQEVRAPGLNSYNDLWYETPDGYVFSAWVQPLWVWPPQPTLPSVGEWGFWGEICAPFTDARSDPSLDASSPYRFYNGNVYHVIDVAWDDQSNGWYKVYDEFPPPTYQWAPARDVRRVTREEFSPIHPFAGAKRVEVDLTRQRITCFEGDQTVFTTPCSSGIGMQTLADGSPWDLSTPVGDLGVLLKQPSRHMSNRPQKPEDPYPPEMFDLPGIPWNTFFDRSGTAIHGVYWHNDFGVRRSHGCLNVSTDAARWIYRWTYPLGGTEDDYVQSDYRVGTPIKIFE
jgi:hypothetical protein